MEWSHSLIFQENQQRTSELQQLVASQQQGKTSTTAVDKTSSSTSTTPVTNGIVETLAHFDALDTCLTLFRHFPATITSRRDGLSVLTTSSHNNGNDTKSAATNNNPSWKVRVDATKSKVQTRVAWSRTHFLHFLTASLDSRQEMVQR